MLNNRFNSLLLPCVHQVASIRSCCHVYTKLPQFAVVAMCTPSCLNSQLLPCVHQVASIRSCCHVYTKLPQFAVVAMCTPSCLNSLLLPCVHQVASIRCCCHVYTNYSCPYFMQTHAWHNARRRSQDISLGFYPNVHGLNPFEFGGCEPRDSCQT
ncbi:hypothetical protein BgiBS90_024199 [Biomphalaria glabrata]|nr:hypothetical protein BgiBS90_024199 [Biomphalaria glabrata]